MALLLVTVLLGPALAAAQKADRAVWVDPDAAFVGSEIRVYGYHEPTSPGRQQVDLEFEPPAGATGSPLAPIVRQVPTDRTGKFELFFDEADTAGTWTVRLAGSRPVVEAEFEITSHLFGAALGASLAREAAATSTLATDFKAIVDPYPDFPEKDQLLADLDEQIRKAADLARQVDQARRELEKLDQLVETNASTLGQNALRALRPVAKQHRELQTEIESRLAAIEDAIDEAERQVEWCARLRWWYQGFDLLGNMNNWIADSLTGLLQNLAIAKGTSGMPPLIQASLATLITIMGVSSGGMVPLVVGIYGLVTSASKEIFSAMVQKYCELFRGKGEGQYYAALLEKGAPFFEMTYTLAGDIWLAFAKRRPGGATVELTGEFKGSLKAPDCTMTMIPFLLPEAGPPIAFCYSPIPPAGARGFQLLLKGEAFDDTIELELDRTAKDFDLRAHGYYLLGEAVTLTPGVVIFPLMNAEWFFTRATHLSNPAVDRFELPLEIRGGKVVAEDEFSRHFYFPETRERKEVTVEISLKINVESK